MTDARRSGRPTRAEAAELRRTLLDRAFAMLSERGLHGFSIDALAIASNVTKRTIYRQYENKAALIEAVVEHEATRFIDGSELPPEGTAPLSRLEDWIRHLFRYLAQSRTQRFALFLRYTGLTEPWAALMLQRWADKLHEAARTLVAAAQRNGDLRTGDPQTLVEVLLDLTYGMLQRHHDLVTDTFDLSGAQLEAMFLSRWRAFLILARPDWAAQHVSAPLVIGDGGHD